MVGTRPRAPEVEALAARKSGMVDRTCMGVSVRGFGGWWGGTWGCWLALSPPRSYFESLPPEADLRQHERPRCWGSSSPVEEEGTVHSPFRS